MEVVAPALFLIGIVCAVFGQSERSSFNCALVRCARPTCLNPTRLPGRCCQVCPKLPTRCAAALCLQPDCADTVTPPGECCPVCRVKAEKPGRCPRRRRFQVGICVERCTSDSSCPGIQKCCNNGCGHTCMRPIRRGHCDRVHCPQLRCVSQHTLPGQCCPTCRPPPVGHDCSTVYCTQQHCVRPYTPPGQCCPICRPNRY